MARGDLGPGESEAAERGGAMASNKPDASDATSDTIARTIMRVTTFHRAHKEKSAQRRQVHTAEMQRS